MDILASGLGRAVLGRAVLGRAGLGRAVLGRAVALPRSQVVAQGKRPGLAEGTLEVGPGKLRIHERFSDQYMTMKIKTVGDL